MFTFGEIAWMFLIYAMLGWLWETPYVSIKNKKFVNRGFLRGPIIPIYGFAATTIMVSLKMGETYFKVEGWEHIGLTFIFASFVATLWEYVTSAILEKLFKTRWWDYSQVKINLKGRIALGVSIFWGAGSTLLWFFINDTVIALYQKVPESTIKAVLIGIYSIVLIDTAITVVEMASLRKIVIKLQQTSEELVANLTDKLEHLGEPLIIEFLREAKKNIKSKAIYRNYESFQAFNEFIDEMTNKGKELKLDNENLRIKFKEELVKIKGEVRFFKNYPNAKTKHFQMMFIIRKLDFIKQELKNQMNNKKPNEKNGAK